MTSTLKFESTWRISGNNSCHFHPTKQNYEFCFEILPVFNSEMLFLNTETKSGEVWSDVNSILALLLF